jgi:TPR repeat protein
MRPADFEKFINDQGYVRAPNFAKTQKATQKAAKRGDPAAQLALGTLCLLGYGVPQNIAAAAHWFEKAANRGDRDAQFILGELYWGGEGVLRDHDQAVKWFRRAAAQGDLQAHRVLAILGVASDDEEQDPQVSTGIHKQNRVIPIGRHPQHTPV